MSVCLFVFLSDHNSRVPPKEFLSYDRTNKQTHTQTDRQTEITTSYEYITLCRRLPEKKNSLDSLEDPIDYVDRKTPLYDELSIPFIDASLPPTPKVEHAKRIKYILEPNLDNPSVCILSVPFSLKGSSKCTNHVNVHKLYAVEYIHSVCSLDYPFQFRIF